MQHRDTRHDPWLAPALDPKKYDGSAKNPGGRPRKAEDIRDLIVRMAKENSGWGYKRIVGAMKNLGHDVGRMTVARVLAEHGIDPAPGRSKGMSWSEFLRVHWESRGERFRQMALRCAHTSQHYGVTMQA